MEDPTQIAAYVMYMFMCTVVSVLLLELEEEEEEEEEQLKPNVEAIADAVAAFRRLRKRAYTPDTEEQPSKKKYKYDYERAIRCIQQDYLGPDPLYEKQFERIFRVSHGIVERLIQVTGAASSFFTHRQLVTHEPGIWPEARVLLSLKTLGFGCSTAAFIDYFQMGLTSGRTIETVKEGQPLPPV